ncbi:MAG TPA: RusA family crossover junction endodeoxyribonuclease [Candidatus Saccharimonadales bacterium]
MRSSNRSYDNQTRDKVSFGLYLAQQHNDEPFFDKPIHLDVTFYMPIPNPIKERSNSVYHATAPFLDNLYRFLVDAIKDIVIADDRVICSLSVKKVYDKEPRTEIVITEVA